MALLLIICFSAIAIAIAANLFLASKMRRDDKAFMTIIREVKHRKRYYSVTLGLTKTLPEWVKVLGAARTELAIHNKTLIPK